MTNISDLIDMLCPQGVEFHDLGSLGRRNKGTPITASMMKTMHNSGGPIRIFAGGNTVADVNDGVIPEKDIIREPSIIVKSRGHIGFTYYEKPFTHKNELWSYTVNNPIVEQKFVYYYLLTQTSLLQEHARATSVKLPQLSVRNTDELRIPVPPLEVQQEIVSILDNFTRLEAELKAELDTRKKQYEYYRNQLLNFEKTEGIKWKTIAEIAKVTIGEFVHKNKQNPEGQYPVYNGGREATGHYDNFNNEGEKIVISARGAYAGFVNMLTKPYWAGNSSYSIDVLDRENVNWIYVYYILKSSENKFTEQQQKGGIPAVSKKQVEQFRIPIPAIAEQNRIVHILEKFDKLLHDTSEGLPAEINARRKQYEYYRSQLLSFQEKPA